MMPRVGWGRGVEWGKASFNRGWGEVSARRPVFNNPALKARPAGGEAQVEGGRGELGGR